MDRGVWRAIVYGVAESDTTEWSGCGGLERCFLGATDSHTHTHTHTHTHFVESVPGFRAPDMPWGRSEVEVGLTRCPEGLSWFLRD